jgi:hypothetical protein
VPAVNPRVLDLARQLARLAVDYADLIIAAALALYVSYEGLQNDLKGDELTQATVALLAVLAIVIFRERWERSRAVRSVEAALSVATSAKPWRVLNANMTWELLASDGSKAIARADKDIRFEQDEVFSLYEWQSRPVGTVTRHECQGRAAGSAAFRPLPIIYDALPGPGGRTYRVISLEGVWRRGQRMTYRSERELQDFFKEPRENVSVRVDVPTDHISLTVIWPRDRKPRHIEVERSGRAADIIDIKQLKRAGQGRSKHVVTVAAPTLNEQITISWDW